MRPAQAYTWLPIHDNTVHTVSSMLNSHMYSHMYCVECEVYAVARQALQTILPLAAQRMAAAVCQMASSLELTPNGSMQADQAVACAMNRLWLSASSLVQQAITLSGEDNRAALACMIGVLARRP